MLFAAAISVCATAFGHGRASSAELDTRAIEFPDTAEFQTLVVDLHTHSVFSDGHVWPRIRIGEALRDGLDAIAITEHTMCMQILRISIPQQPRHGSE